MDGALPSCREGNTVALCEPQFDLGPLGSHTRKATYLLLCSYTSTVSRPSQLSPLTGCLTLSRVEVTVTDRPACFLRPRESLSGIHSDFFKPMCHTAGETTHRMPLFTLFGHVIQWWVTVTPPPTAPLHSLRMRCKETSSILLQQLRAVKCGAQLSIQQDI